MKNTTYSQGFTLIELLVVVAIVGVLAAIAVPQYSTYKSGGVDSQMKSALKNGRTAMEAYYIQTSIYLSPGDEPELENNGYRQTAPVTLTIAASSATDYKLCACAEGGNFACFEFRTTAGQMTGITAPCDGSL